MSESKAVAYITETLKKIAAGQPVDDEPLQFYLTLIGAGFSVSAARRVLSLYIE